LQEKQTDEDGKVNSIYSFNQFFDIYISNRPRLVLFHPLDARQRITILIPIDSLKPLIVDVLKYITIMDLARYPGFLLPGLSPIWISGNFIPVFSIVAIRVTLIALSYDRCHTSDFYSWDCPLLYKSCASDQRFEEKSSGAITQWL